MPHNLKHELLGSVSRASPRAEERFFEPNDMRWGETVRGDDRGTVYLNTGKFGRAGGVRHRYAPKMMLGESLHNLKHIAPERYERMYQAATSDPGYDRWMRNSYDHSRADYGEERSLEDWHRESRFDQVMGGYLFAGDEDLPTMKEWSRTDLPYGDALTKELELLRQDLGID